MGGEEKEERGERKVGGEWVIGGLGRTQMDEEDTVNVWFVSASDPNQAQI